MTELVTLADGSQVWLHYNHWLPRLFGGINNCITLNGRAVLVSRDWITARGLAHEVGHIYQARARGWRYLPWVLWCYVTHGYRNSPCEVDADRYMVTRAHLFANHGPVPTWVVDT